MVAGTDLQIEEFKRWLEMGETANDGSQDIIRQRIPFTLEQFVVTAAMPFCGKSLAESHIKEKAQCAVLGIEHEGQTYMNPDASILLLEGDTVILCGEAPRIQKLLAHITS